jgi:hypothetical protein
MELRYKFGSDRSIANAEIRGDVDERLWIAEKIS